MGAPDPKKVEEEARKKREQEFSQFLSGNQQYKDMLGNINSSMAQLKATAGERPGIALTQQNEFEKRAGVTPPGYEGTRDVRTGQLLDQYKTDAYGGEALKALKGQAFAEGASPWAQAQLLSQRLDEQNAKGGAQRQAMSANSMAQSQLARSGGLRGGASALLARQSQRDLMGANQGVARQGMQQRASIGQQDVDRKGQLMSQLGNLETQANQANLGQSTSDITRKAMFDMERYKQQMQAWGAQQSADATRAAGGGGGKK